MHSDLETQKHAAAQHSLGFIRDGMDIGLGSGSTARYMIELLGTRVRQGLRVRAVPSSRDSAELARARGIPLSTLDQTPALDLTIDGADEFDGELNLIKGGGGALLYEKVIAAASRQLIIIADSSKQVERLGSVPLPVEVLAFAQRPLADRLAHLATRPPELRRTETGAPVVTQEGNLILDCRFGPIHDPAGLAVQIKSIPGVVEHGLFVGMANIVIVGRPGGVECLER